ncbi:gamma-glutamyl-gamma-aminobutyrate hydrolase family protein [soil metagenome]
MVYRPRIGITMRLEIETRRFYLGRDYSEAVEAFGGIPVHIALIPKREYIVEALNGLDGVLLPGSNTDVDPHFYGEEPHHRLGTVIPEKDETDRLLIEEAELLNLPLLAICYGMQALNVVRGGTLVQDIESQVEESIKHEQGIPQFRNSHSLKIGEQGILAGLDAEKTATGPIRVNSSHHQAIGKIGSDLSATAWASDGVVECIEDTRDDRFALGVQWHPELSSRTDRLSGEIFKLFVDVCRRGRD